MAGYRERIRQIIEGTKATKGVLNKIWISSSDQIKKDFPLEKLVQRKSKGGVYTQIAQMAKEGKTFEEIKLAGFTKMQIGNSRINFKSRGIEIPYQTKASEKTRQLASNLQDPRKTPKKRQELLEKASYHQLDLLKKEGILFPLYKFLRLGTLTTNPRMTKFFAWLLKKKGIGIVERPMKIKSGPKKGLDPTYYFMAAVDSEKAKKVLDNLTLQMIKFNLHFFRRSDTKKI